MSLKTIIKKWLDGDNSAAQQQNIIDVLNKQQQAILQQFAQMQHIGQLAFAIHFT